MAHQLLKCGQPALLVILVLAVGLACARTPNPLVLPNYATSQPTPSATFAPDAIAQLRTRLPMAPTCQMSAGRMTQQYKRQLLTRSEHYPT